MIQLNLQEIDSIWRVLPPRPDFIIVGEVHGSEQNAPIIRSCALALLTRARHITIAFEWDVSDEELKMINDYLLGGDVPERLPKFFLDSDGRVTVQHLDLLRWIRSYNKEHNNRIDIYAFDFSQDSPGNDIEQRLASALLTRKTQIKDSLFLVETGNVHARLTPNIVEGREVVPMAKILSYTSSVFSLFLKYRSGTVLVEGTPKDVTMAASQQEGQEMYFDAVIEVPESLPAQEISVCISSDTFETPH